MDTHRWHPPEFEPGPVFKVTIYDLRESASSRMSWNIKSSGGYGFNYCADSRTVLCAGG
jgi:hypothetical protein